MLNINITRKPEDLTEEQSAYLNGCIAQVTSLMYSESVKYPKYVKWLIVTERENAVYCQIARNPDSGEIKLYDMPTRTMSMIVTPGSIPVLEGYAQFNDIRNEVIATWPAQNMLFAAKSHGITVEDMVRHLLAFCMETRSLNYDDFGFEIDLWSNAAI